MVESRQPMAPEEAEVFDGFLLSGLLVNLVKKGCSVADYFLSRLCRFLGFASVVLRNVDAFAI